MLKRMIGILLAVVMAASLICVAGCEEAEKNGGGGNVQTEEPQEDGKD